MRRRWIMVAIGVLLVVGSSIGFSRYMKTYQLDVTMMDTYKPVRMIQAGELITSNMVHKVSIPTITHMGNSLINENQIIGRRAIVPIGEMEEILSWKIGEDALYPTGDEEYIGFKVDFVGAVNNMVRRGDKVSAWVEYLQPKIYDTAGREISETEQATLLTTNPMITFKKVYTKELLEKLTVAYVKDQDGNEITDVGTSSSPIALPGSENQRDENNAERYRQNASGQPMYITFIMSHDEYETFAAGAKDGTIRLGLPGQATIFGTIKNNPEGAKK